jgi:hypothetical protein
VRRLARGLALHPFEIFTYAMTLVVIAFLRANGLGTWLALVEFSLPPMFASCARARDRLACTPSASWSLQPAARLAARARDARLGAAWLRVWLAAMAMTFSYKWLSACRCAHDGGRSGAVKLDRWLHLGVSPSIFTVELLEGMGCF